MRATTRAPRVKKMRLRSSLALEMEPKLKLAASCSAADAIKLLPETCRCYPPAGPFSPTTGPTLYGDAVPPLRGGAVQFYALRASRFLVASARRVWRLPGP